MNDNAIFRIRIRDCRLGTEKFLDDTDFTSEENNYYSFDKHGYKISVKIINDSLSDGANKIYIKTDGDFTAEEVVFPIVKCDDTLISDNLLFSTPWGDNIREPAKTIRMFYNGRNTRTASSDYIKCTAENEVSYIYPSVMAMRYIVLYNDSKSRYLACYTTGDDSIAFRARALNRWNNDLELSVAHFPFLRNGEWTSPVCETLNIDGDWHSATDLYIERSASDFKEPDRPLWMTDKNNGFNGWAEVPMKFLGKEPLLKFTELPSVFRETREKTGLNTIHVYGWSGDGHDTFYPDFDVCPQLGTEEELKAACEEIRKDGGHIILYLNGRLVDPQSRFGKKYKNTKNCVDRNGNYYYENCVGGLKFNINCPSEPEFREELNGVITRLIDKYGAGAVQIDQIGCNYSEFCYNPDHHHSTPANNFIPGVKAQMIKFRENYKSKDPDFFVWCEGCNELYGQFYDVEQGVGEYNLTWRVGESKPEQYGYCNKRRVVTGTAKSLPQVCYTFTEGRPFDIPYDTFKDCKEISALVKRLVEFRKEYSDFYYYGDYEDNKFVLSDTTNRVGAIVSEDKKEMLVAINKLTNNSIDGKNTAYLKPDKEWADSECFETGLADCKVIKDGSFVKIEFTGPVTAVIFKK